MSTMNNLSIFLRFSYLYKTRYLTYSTSPSTTTSLYFSMKKLIDSKQYQKALDLFQQQSGPRTDVFVNMALKACTKLHDHQCGINIEKQLTSHSRNNPFIQTSLIHFYMQCHDVDNANRIFSTIVNKSNVTYRAMFAGLILNEMSNKVFDLLDEMIIEPDLATLIMIFTTCAQVNDDRAKQIGNKLLNQMPNDFRNDTILLTSAIHMLMRFGDVKNAEELFESIKKKDVISYGTMMKGYVENGMSDKALDLFEKMSSEPNNFIYAIIFGACTQLKNDRGKTVGKKVLDQILSKSRIDNIVSNSAIHMLMSFGNVKSAEHLFELNKKNDVVGYGAMMKGYNLNNNPLKCLKLFEKMKKQDIIPDEITFNLLINACSQFSMLSRCQSIVAQIPSYIYNKQPICSALIDMWGKAGSVENARQIFESIHNPDVIIYTAMINSFGRNGKGLEAVELYRKMPHHLRNEVSHICVLNACSHAGLLDEARAIFNEINIKTEQITTIMIDCLSRLFLFDEAQKLIDDYEKTNSPYLQMYMAMLSGARNCRHSALSEKIYNRMKMLFPNQKVDLKSGSILLGNIYTSLGDYEKAETIRSNATKEYGKKVKPGLSWTEVDGEIAEFTAHDHSHPLSEEVHAEMKQIANELIEHGHKFDGSWITRQIHEGETIESILCGHSEKLAIAFNFIRGRRPSFIQVTKNLRICGDCHQATKLIAKIRQCEIIIRDANRNHHFFPNGKCSCHDHF